MIETLIEWTENYFKHKDIFEKKLENISKEKDSLILKYKDRTDIAIINAVFEKEIFEKLKEFNNYTKLFVICSKSQTNVDFLIENWKKFLIQNLIVIFADVKMNDKILINPYVHNKICDETTLNSGIRALFVEK